MVEGQITAPDIHLNHIHFTAEGKMCAGLCSHITLCIHRALKLCKLCEIYPHCIFDDEGLSHAAAGNESTRDRRPNSMVTSARANRAILQNYNILALVGEALNVNLSAEFHAENKR